MRNLTLATIGDYAEIIKRNGLKMSIMDDNLIHNANALLALEGRLCTITEAQRQGAQELAMELRAWAVDIQHRAGIDNHTAKGMTAAMELLLIKLDVLCPPAIAEESEVIGA